MNKRGWIIPIAIVAVNTLAIAARWSSLPELLPAHFDLQGNAAGTMSRNSLLLYPLIGVTICLAAYIIARIKQTLKTGVTILSSGICLILLSSTLVSLTQGFHACRACDITAYNHSVHYLQHQNAQR